MAWLEMKGEVYRIRFRFNGRKQLLPLKCRGKQEANDCLQRFEENSRFIDRGLIDAPPQEANIGLYILTGGKRCERIGETKTESVPTLATLFEAYLVWLSGCTKEANTCMTEKTHIKHLRRLIDDRTPLKDVTAKTLQAFIDARHKEQGRYEKGVCSRTVKKEVATFAYIWNQFGITRELIENPAPTQRLKYAKERGKPPFQTREQIERQMTRSQLTESEKAELWSCLFLTLPEIEELLEFVTQSDSPSYSVAIFAFAAHTGARRSEIIRSRIDDIDFERGLVQIREKKRATDHELTYRSVPLSPRLSRLLREWLAHHPGGIYTFATRQGQPITRQWASELMGTIFEGSKWDVLPGWHCFRHSFISNCVAKGIDQRLIDHWVGHTTDAMRRRYSHLIPSVSQAALLSVFA